MRKGVYLKAIALLIALIFVSVDMGAYAQTISPDSPQRQTLATFSSRSFREKLIEGVMNFFGKGQPHKTIPKIDETEEQPLTTDAGDEPGEMSDQDRPGKIKEQKEPDQKRSSDNKIIRQFLYGLLWAAFYLETSVLWLNKLNPIIGKIKYRIQHDGVPEDFWDKAFAEFNDHGLDFYYTSGALATIFIIGAVIVFGVYAARYLKATILRNKKRVQRSDLARYISYIGYFMRRTWGLLALFAVIYFEGIEPRWFAGEGDAYRGKFGDSTDTIVQIIGFALFMVIFIRPAFKEAWKQDKSNWQLIKKELEKIKDDFMYLVKTGRMREEEDALGVSLDEEIERTDEKLDVQADVQAPMPAIEKKINDIEQPTKTEELRDFMEKTDYERRLTVIEKEFDLRADIAIYDVEESQVVDINTVLTLARDEGKPFPTKQAISLINTRSLILDRAAYNACNKMIMDAVALFIKEHYGVDIESVEGKSSFASTMATFTEVLKNSLGHGNKENGSLDVVIVWEKTEDNRFDLHVIDHGKKEIDFLDDSYISNNSHLSGERLAFTEYMEPLGVLDQDFLVVKKDAKDKVIEAVYDKPVVDEQGEKVIGQCVTLIWDDIPVLTDKEAEHHFFKAA